MRGALAATSMLALIAACAHVAVNASSGGPRFAPAPSETSLATEAGASPRIDPFVEDRTARDVFALPLGPRDDDPLAPLPPPLDLAAWKAANQAKGAPAARRQCAEFSTRVAAVAPSADLAAALSVTDPGRRDALLVGLAPSYREEKQLWLRALRADLAPVECADTIVDPFLRSWTELASPVSNVVVGLSIAAKLSRTNAVPPSLWGLRDKQKTKAFVAGPLKIWFVEQCVMLDTLAAGAAGLSSYGRGIAAIEHGLAELRLVERLRAALTATAPSSWDAELKAHYEGVLGITVAARKTHGRDVLLGGLADLAQVGILVDSRVDRARTILARTFPERRIDALDALMLPARPGVTAAATPLDKASQLTPTFWLGFLGADSDSLAVLVRGVPQPARARHRRGNNAADIVDNAAYSRTRFELGRTYWRRVDFVEAAHAAYSGQSQDDRLVYALSLALVHGPNDAVAMMLAPSRDALDLTHTEALDAVAEENGIRAGMAAFDAAYLRSLCAPDGSGEVAYLRDVARRFHKAELLLSETTLKKRAAAHAVELDERARSLE